MAMKRLLREHRDIQKDPPPYCRACPVAEDIFHWRATIEGPPDSPYAGGIFRLDMRFSHNYPFEPPKVVFITKVFHPNIDTNGIICADIFGEMWSLLLTISKVVFHVLISICSILTGPNPDDALMPEIAHLYKTNRIKYETMARSWTLKYARG